MKNKIPSIKKNFLLNCTLTMSSFLFPLITFPYISRVLLPVGTGKVSFATSLVYYFDMFAQLGIPTYGVRACAKVRDNREELSRTVHEILMINISMAILSYIALVLALLFVPRLREDRTLYIAVSLIIVLNVIGMEWLYKALEQYAYITIRSIVFKLIAVIAMFLLVHKESDYVIYGFISIFAVSASNILNFLNCRKFIDMHPVGNYNPKRHMKAISIFFAMACATTIYTHLDVVMLGFMKTDEEVGFYNAAVRIKTILVSIVTSLGVVLLPRASYYVERNEMDKFHSISKKAINFVVILAAPLMLYFIIFARQGIYFLSGMAFEHSVLPMQIIMPTLLFIGFTNILGIQILVPTGREMIVLYSEIAGAITDLLLNMLLIPRLGAAGAAIGTLAAEFVVLLVQYYSLRQEVGVIFRNLEYGKIVFAVLVGVIASIWAVKVFSNSFVILLVSGILFFGMYGLMLLVMKEGLTVELFGDILKRVKKVL